MSILCLLFSGCARDPAAAARLKLRELGVQWEVRESRIGADRFSVDLAESESVSEKLLLIHQGLRPVERLSCRQLDLLPADLQTIGQLSELKQLDLFGVPLHQAAVRLVHLAELRSLNLAGADNGDSQLQQLLVVPVGGPMQLETLAVGRLTTDDGLQHLSKLQNLRTLFLGDSQVNGSGLQFLPAGKLQTLYLDRTPITNAQAPQLERFANLQRLGLAGTAIDDAGAASLGKLLELDYLSIEDTEISDKSIDLLASLPKLYVLDIAGSKITPAGAQRLKTLRPQLVIGQRIEDETAKPEYKGAPNPPAKGESAENEKATSAHAPCR